MTFNESMDFMRSLVDEHGPITVKRVAGDVIDSVGFANYEIEWGPESFGEDEKAFGEAVHVISNEISQWPSAEPAAFHSKGGNLVLSFTDNGLANIKQRSPGGEYQEIDYFTFDEMFKM